MKALRRTQSRHRERQPGRPRKPPALPVVRGAAAAGRPGQGARIQPRDHASSTNPCATWTRTCAKRCASRSRNSRGAQESRILYVTHDQEIALALSDRIAIMDRAGRIRQVGTPYEIFENPGDSYVYRFMGVSNFIPVRADGNRVTVEGTDRPMDCLFPEKMSGRKELHRRLPSQRHRTHPQRGCGFRNRGPQEFLGADHRLPRHRGRM